MSIPLTINGTTYDYPIPGDIDWGPSATDWAAAVTTGMLQKAGGLFQLLAELDFGTTYGVKTLYLKSRTASPADAGQIRLAKTDVVSWRNNAGGGNLDLGINGSDALIFNGTALQNAVSVSDTATIDLTFSSSTLSADIKTDSITNSMINSAAAIVYSKLDLTGGIVNGDINVAAGIVYSKLTLTGGIVNNDINAAAAIAYSKLSLTGGIVNNDINAAAAIAYSKLALTGSIVNADINAAAAIDFSKLAILSSTNILVGSAGNVATSVAMTGDITISNTGVTAIGANKVANSQLAQMAQSTIKGRAASSGTGDPVDLTATQATAILNVMTGDLGSGGLKGLVPAQSTGDATKFLNGAGTWSTPAGAGDVVGPGSATDNAVVVYDGTTGKLIKNSTVTISSGALTAPGALRSATSLILEDPGAGTNTVTHIAGTVSASYTFTWPTAVSASSNAALMTSNAGVLSYVVAASANTASTIVQRDGSGNFTAGTITAALVGNADTATTATNLAGGSGGTIPYQSAAGTTAMLANGTVGQSLKSAGTTAAPVWFTAGASYYRMSTGNSLGGSTSGETTVVNFTTTTASAGSDITYTARDTTHGDKFTINVAGLYFVCYSIVDTTAGQHYGITLNSTGLSTGLPSITSSQVWSDVQVPSSGRNSVGSAMIPCAINDIIRFQTESGSVPSATASGTKIEIIRVA